MSAQAIELEPWQKLTAQMRETLGSLPIPAIQEIHEGLRLRMIMLASNKEAPKHRVMTCNALMRATGEAITEHESH